MNSRLKLFSLALIALISSTCSAQYGAMVKGLSATANESVALQPEGIRLALRVQAVGRDGKAAIKSLNEQKEVVRKELATMNATADSIRFSSTEVNSGLGAGGNEARMYGRMMIGNGRGGEEVDEEPETPKLFTASCWVTARWTLPAKEGDAIALLPAMLKAQIAARDLEGKKRKPDLDAEQMEQYQQLTKMMQQNSYGDSDSQTVRIQYFATVSKQIAQKATAAAFDRAKEQAETLSAAAGTSLAKIHSVASNQDESMRQMYRSWNGPGNQIVDAWLKDEPNVEYANSLDALQYSVSVWLCYELL